MVKSTLGITVSALLLSGCSTLCDVGHHITDVAHHRTDVAVNHSAIPAPAPVPATVPATERIAYKNYGNNTLLPQSNHGWLPPVNSYQPVYTHKLLSDYTEQIAMKLIENMRYVSERAPIAVTSFVDLDNNLKTTNILGNQLAESFITEMQEFGLSVVDFKHTGLIEINGNGDFAFSRKAKQLKNTINVQYILSGTLSYSDRGVIVNTRIIGTESKVVVASAKGFIPHFIINSLHNGGGNRRDGVPISAVY